MALFGGGKNEIAALQAEIVRLREQQLPEHRQIDLLQAEIVQLQEQQQQLELSLAEKSGELQAVWKSLKEKKAQVIETDETILLQEIGFYTPRYSFLNAELYKARLAVIRQQQKDMAKAGRAVIGAKNWIINGSSAQGNKLVKDMCKLFLRAFNCECDDIVEHVKHNNFEASLKRIAKSASDISNLGSVMQISIAPPYYNLKVEELTLALEYAQKKQQEKEEEKERRAQMREDAKVQRELEQKRKDLEKESNHYENTLTALQGRLEKAEGVEAEAIKLRIEEAQNKIEEIQKAQKDIDYREANKRAGYVYVISNIGSFGEGVYKIGMTRRLDPMERIFELSDASVPFNFDLHAMIFSEDAPKLETALHTAFEDAKVNMVNQRREFFRVSLDDIKAVVRANYDKIAEFIDIPEAEQFHVSENTRKSKIVSN
ncbi:MAG: DUF4041 domain-containing protein [Clostridium sp.]|jgi:hypothetical protein|nr:DUF4041 domain-containing protein [Clostridium sp.]